MASEDVIHYIESATQELADRGFPAVADSIETTLDTLIRREPIDGVERLECLDRQVGDLVGLVAAACEAQAA
jgi:hypothetical protein